MPLLTQGKTNWKYIIIVLILAVIVGGGILGWIKRKEVAPTEFPEIKKPEEEKIEVEYKTFTVENFSIDYPSLWEPIQEGTMGIMGEPITGWTKGEAPDMCVEAIEVYEGTSLKLFGPKLYENEIESYINSVSSNVISRESEVVDSEYGKKYIWYYDFVDKENIKGKLWAVVFDCGDNFLICFECAGKEAEKDQTEIINHVISSIRCGD